jgi:hypothetical protein
MLLSETEITKLWPPEELDTQVPDKQCAVEFQFFTSLLRRGGGWFANHALHPATAGRPSRHCCNRCVPWAGSLSLGR